MTSIVDLSEDLAAAAPALRSLLAEHRAEHGALLTHLYMADVTRWLVATGPSAAALLVLERHMTEGDDEVQNVVCLSFLENLEPEHTEIRAALGPRLREALAGMEGWSPEAAI